MGVGISIREMSDITLVDLRGHLTSPEGKELRATLKQQLAQGKKKFGINLKRVERVDAEGLGALAAIFVSCQREDAVLKLYGPNAQVHQAIKNGHLDGVIEIHAREKDVLASWGQRTTLLSWLRG